MLPKKQKRDPYADLALVMAEEEHRGARADAFTVSTRLNDDHANRKSETAVPGAPPRGRRP